MTGFGLTSPTPAELAARAALNEGLNSLRISMREILTESRQGWLTRQGRFMRTVRGDSGVPRTRQRPHHNEAPPRQAGVEAVRGDNTRQLPERSGTARPGTVPGPGGGPPPPGGGPHSPGGGQHQPTGAPNRDQIPTQGGRNDLGPAGGPPGAPAGGAPAAEKPQPARPDPGDAAAAVWELIERAQAGDGAAFGLLYDRYFDTVFRFVYFRVGNRQLAEDLTADTFLRALKRISSFTWQGRDLGAWLVTIARNLVADHFKSGRYRLEVTTGDVLDADRPERGLEGSPEAAVIDHITNVGLLKAVKQLNPEQQECIVLRFLHGFSVAETAQAMSKNEGAIKALQYRAVRALARLLPEGFQP
jgi:RNA polymerase sigma-70 factor (ECF subfamily)